MLIIKFPADNRELAGAIGKALTEYGAGVAPSMPEVTREESVTETKTVGDVSQTTTTVKKEIPVTTTPGDKKAEAAGETDPNGVAFNADFCGRAKDPFYATGKMIGQWKKRQGVDKAEYDEWYAAALLEAQPAGEDQEINTAEAFGGKKEPAAEDKAPADAGQFMEWLSEHQTAGRLTQPDIDAAYQSTGVQVADLFNPATAADAVAQVYAVLKQAVDA